MADFAPLQNNNHLNQPIYPEPTHTGPSFTALPTNLPAGPDHDPAVELIRAKIQALYAEEPNAQKETAEVKALPTPGSVHQQYMAKLNAAGLSLVEIQAAWHNYYIALPEHEKYQVWQEFYVNSNASGMVKPAKPQTASPSQMSPQHVTQPRPAMILPAAQRPATVLTSNYKRHEQTSKAAQKAAAQVKDFVANGMAPGSSADIKKRILNSVHKSVTAGGKLQTKHHLQSLAFGLGMGSLVVFVVLFSFFNELLIAPFIQPSRKATETPVIVDIASTVISGGSKILIPKINVEIPIDYSQTTTDEKSIELALDKGIVHYPTTVKPGQAGNGAYFGHSSNNIFNPGKYKFAFVLLNKLEPGDVFYISNDGVNYAYKVFNKRVVQPAEVGVLGPVADKAATATLITCDPPGTSINRLVVVGEQISPEPGANPKPAASPPILTATAASPALPGNGPTLWSRIWGSVF